VPTVFWEASSGRILVGRLATGSDLVAEIEDQCAEQGILAAEVTVIGAVRRVRYAYYEQAEQRYRELATETHHEITGFVGNVSVRDDVPFLHAHATFADADGATVGGHLLRGIEVFAAEVVIRELRDVSLVRRHDAETGLALW
jgi:predicted DNA-binding protein with PD1-like motif